MSTDDAQPEIPCPPCRATGRVISNLGGTPQEIECPWCEGTTRLTAGHDAQARWREGADAPPAEAG